MTSSSPNPALQHLLQETVTTHVASSTRIASVETVALSPGLSGAAVHRHHITLQDSSGRATQAQLVTKEAWLRERRVLALLTAQRQPNVPFTHTLDLTTEGPALICQQDVGDIRRPTSLEPITDEALQREAQGLAAIHSANMGQASALEWLPRTDRAYFAGYVLDRCWRPHWERMLTDNAFVAAFGAFISLVEAAAEPMAEEMAALAAEEDALTLIHTDINPSNVLVHHDQPFYIDWQVAHYGPLYFDLPHHFCRLQQAEHYRKALAVRGKEIPSAAFEERYRAAALCIGFRYIWWTLELWQTDHRQTAWVMHYIGLILGSKANSTLPAPRPAPA
jgi:aminoglycoside phosphotransferase (APT) family kinase protein